MLVAVVVLAVLAGVLAVLLVRERRRAGAAREAARAEAERLSQELVAATGRAEDAAAARDEADAARDAAAERATAAEDAFVTAHEALAAAEERALVAERLAQQAGESAEAAADRAIEVESERLALLASLHEAETRRAELAAEVAPLRERLLALDAASRRALEADRAGIEAAALWDLELARSERTWRHSVAASPDGPGPFGDTDDPLRTAVEIEVAALREDVGAAMELTWDTDVTDPARCLTILRLTQELLAAAARDQQAVILRAHQEPGGEVVLHLSVPEDHAPLEIDPPPLQGHLVSVLREDGLQVTVR